MPFVRIDPKNVLSTLSNFYLKKLAAYQII